MPGPARPGGGGGPGGIGRAAALSVLLASAIAPGCAEERPPGVLPDSAYVDVVARLVRVDRMAEEARNESRTFRAESARRAILEEAGLGRQELRDYALAMGDDPEHMTDVWQRIEARVSELERAAADTLDAEAGADTLDAEAGGDAAGAGAQPSGPDSAPPPGDTARR